MKRICLIISSVFLTGSVFAQNQISGVVTDQSGTLSGASILVKDNANKFAVTNANGEFLIKNLSSGQVTLITSYAGFKPDTLKIELPYNKALTIKLQALQSSLQPVEIRAIRATDNAPFAKTDLSKAAIEKNNLGLELPYLLDQTPGVVISSDAGNGVGYTGIRIRGSDATRINMTINGIPYNDAESQGLFFVNMPDLASSITSAQIQRGVGTSSNGSGAFGASMNFSTHAYNPVAYAEINNTVGSFNTVKNTLKLGSGLIGGKFTFDARLSRATSDGYVDRASSDLKSAQFSASYWGEKSSLKLNVILGQQKTYQAWNGITQDKLDNDRTYNPVGLKADGTFYDNETDNYKQKLFQLLYSHSLRNNWTFNTAAFLTLGKGYYEQYRVADSLNHYGLPQNVETDLIRRLWLDNAFYGQTLSLQKSAEKYDLAFGGGWSNYFPADHFGEIIWAESNPALNHQWYNLRSRKTEGNFYTKYTYKLNSNWQLFGDLQFRYVNYKLGGFRKVPTLRYNEEWLFVNPKAGISYSNKNWHGFFSYAIGNKEPNRDDFETGENNKPKREKLHDFELSIGRKNIVKGWHANVTLYNMQYTDQLVLTGQINDVGATARTNVANSFRRGVEFESQYSFKNFGIKYNIALSSNKIKDFTQYIDKYSEDWEFAEQLTEHFDKTNIAMSPAVVQGINLFYNPIKNISFDIFSKYISRQYLDNTSSKDRSLDGYFVNDARATYTYKSTKFIKEIKFVVQVNNVFNKLYVANGYTYRYMLGNQLGFDNGYYPMATRNILVALNIKL